MSPEIPPNPLHIPELVGRLCRRTNLLQDPNETYTHLTSSYHRSLRFHTTLTTFPHLIRHVRRLSISPIDIFGSNITQKTLEKICNIPFAHLESVFMFIRKRLDYRPAIQQLFSLSTVVHLKLDIFLGDVSFFVDVWKCYSRGLRHLKLVVWLDLADDYETYDADPLTCGMPIQLDSLRDAFTYDNSGPDSQDLYTWVLHPFGLSHLKPLAICDEMGVSWEKFGKLFKFFDVFAPTFHKAQETALGLSSLPNLSVFLITRDESISPRNALHCRRVL